ncbi:hypothetical protein DPMN_116157 [Dreissena polymorpha]|uniref:Uncharacterized protein n=1 Tax=Dreissena polymorpha TaxID=45954 RepID=A0A9D4QUG5_DREPO|nr:hypothetical protein DPMN_116157 [Dreissena polymorpha]
MGSDRDSGSLQQTIQPMKDKYTKLDYRTVQIAKRETRTMKKANEERAMFNAD